LSGSLADEVHVISCLTRLLADLRVGGCRVPDTLEQELQVEQSAQKLQLVVRIR